MWPLVSIDTFQLVRVSTTDLWMVKTVGSLIAVAGLVIFLAGLRNQVAYEIFVLGAGSAAVLVSVDVNFSLQDIISRIYLMDAVVEAIIVCWWLRNWLSAIPDDGQRHLQTSSVANLIL